MYTRKTMTYGIDVSDLRAWMADRGVNLPDEFAIRYVGNALTVDAETPTTQKLIWLEVTEES